MPYHRCPACGLTSYVAAAYSSVSECPNCSAALAEASKLRAVPAPRRELERRLLARPQAAGEARRALRSLALSPATRDRLALVVSELVTNAVRHAAIPPSARLDLRVTSSPGLVRVAVRDRGQGFSPPPFDGRADPLAVGGQGLVIVAALSESWGVECDADGCTVWCAVALEQPDSAAEERVTTGYVRELAIEMARAELTASP